METHRYLDFRDWMVALLNAVTLYNSISSNKPSSTNSVCIWYRFVTRNYITVTQSAHYNEFNLKDILNFTAVIQFRIIRVH